MIKKEAKGKTAAKKAEEGRRKKEEGRRRRGRRGARNAILEACEMASPRSWNRAGAKKIAKAVMDQALTGQLAPTKYLFERAEIYPQATDGSPRIVDEESLAVVAPIGYFRGADHAGRGRIANRCFSGEIDCEASGRRRRTGCCC